MDMNAFERAVDHFGSQAKLAEALNVEPMAVTHWKRRGLPPQRAVEIENVTDGTVTRYDLLPELFGCAPPAQQVA